MMEMCFPCNHIIQSDGRERSFPQMHGTTRVLYLELLFILVLLVEKREMQSFRSGKDSFTVLQCINVSQLTSAVFQALH